MSLKASVSKECDVRFGSEADICTATSHVRFAPNSDRESRDAANGDVRFTPKSGRVRRKPSCLLWAKSGHRLWRARGQPPPVHQNLRLRLRNHSADLVFL
jgi:hypothetical protein